MVREHTTESSGPSSASQPPPNLPVTQTNRAKKIPKYILIAALLFAFATIPLHWIQGAIERSGIEHRPPGTQIGKVTAPTNGDHPIDEGATAILGQHKVEIVDGSYIWRLLRWGFTKGDIGGNTWFGEMLRGWGFSGSFVYLLDLSNPTPFTVFCLMLFASWISRMFTEKWKVSGHE